MQLSTLVLSATALLAQAASGFYLLKTTDTDLAGYGFAKISFGTNYAGGGFYSSTAHPYATINLDAQGDIGSGFVLRKVDGSTWMLMSRAAASIESNDITRPFAIEVDKRFVYKGEGGGVWNVCVGDPGSYQLYLSTTPIEHGGCIGNLTLVATEFI